MQLQNFPFNNKFVRPLKKPLHYHPVMFDRMSERPHKHPTEQNEPYFVILFIFCNVLDIAIPAIIPHLPIPLSPIQGRIQKKKEPFK